MKIKANLTKILWIFLVSLILKSCSIRIIYSQLDWLIPWYVSDYISLDERQQVELEKRINDILHWHRTTQLKEYSSLLRETREDFSKNITEEQLKEIYLKFEDAWRTMMIKVAPDIVEMLMSATDEQKLELYENIELKNEEFYKEYIDISDEKKTKRRIRRVQKRIERWLGPLNKEQEILLVSYVHRFVPNLYDRFEFRNSWQWEFRRLMDEEPKTLEVKEKLEQLFIDPSHLYTAQFKEKEDENLRLVKQMILDFGEIITPEQFQHLMKQFDKYARMFEEMSV